MKSPPIDAQGMRDRVYVIVCKARDGELLTPHEQLVWQWVTAGGGCHACPPRVEEGD